MEDNLKPFWPMKEDLYTLEGVPMKDDQMYIPTGLRGKVLDCLHLAPQGEILLAKHGGGDLSEEKSMSYL